MSLIFIILFCSDLAWATPGSRQLILDIGNDLFSGPDQTDRNLTNNITVGIFADGLPDWGYEFFENTLSKADSNFYSITLSQYIFTPDDITKEVPDPKDHPYAGWLFASGTVGARIGESLVLYGVDAGIVGPSSLAEKAQVEFHRLVGSQMPKGWKYQLKDEPGVNFRYKLVYRGYYDNKGLEKEFLYHGGGSLGNVNTHIELGAVGRVGINIPDNMNHAPSLSSERVGFYVVVKGDQRLVIRDLFLDGNTFQESASVEKRLLVASGSLGVVVSYADFEVGYSYDVSSRRFKTQEISDRRGTLYFSYQRSF